MLTQVPDSDTLEPILSISERIRLYSFYGGYV